MAEKASSNHTYKDYLALEAESDIKYEYHDGFIVAMAGGSPEHSQIGLILFALRGMHWIVQGNPVSFTRVI